MPEKADHPLLRLGLKLFGVPEHEHDGWCAEFDRQRQQEKDAAWELRQRFRDPTYIPLAVYFSRYKHTARVVDRISRLNPNGVEEGSWPRGWNPKRGWDRLAYDAITPRDFIRRHGAEAYRALPEGVWMHMGLKKAMTRIRYMQVFNAPRP